MTAASQGASVNETFFTFLSYELVATAIYDRIEPKNGRIEQKIDNPYPADPTGDPFDRGFFILESIGYQTGVRYIERHCTMFRFLNIFYFWQ